MSVDWATTVACSATSQYLNHKAYYQNFRNQILFEENAPKTVFCKMAAISARPQCVQWGYYGKQYSLRWLSVRFQVRVIHDSEIICKYPTTQKTTKKTIHIEIHWNDIKTYFILPNLQQKFFLHGVSWMILISQVTFFFGIVSVML